MKTMLIFGLGYTASRLADRLRAEGWQVCGTKREAAEGVIAFDDQRAVLDAIAGASHILSSVPPTKQGEEPVLESYGEALKSGPARWTGYLSSTGVYGDAKGSWVDETAPIGVGRRKSRSEADRRWQDLRGDIRIFRLPGIYGPGRSVLDRVRRGEAKRIDMPGQVFSRVHVDDIISAIIASFDGPPGIYNIADDEPAPQQEVIAYAARALALDVSPLIPLEQAKLSAAAAGFYQENRRVSNGKAKRMLKWEPQYPDYKSGLDSLLQSSD